MRPNPDRDEAAYRAYVAGEPLKAIGARLGVHATSARRSVDRHARRRGLPLPRRYGPDAGTLRADVNLARDAEAYRDYVDGARLEDIAAARGFGCRSSAFKAVNRHARRNGLPKPRRLANARRRASGGVVTVLGMRYRLDVDR